MSKYNVINNYLNLINLKKINKQLNIYYYKYYYFIFNQFVAYLNLFVLLNLNVNKDYY